MVPRVYGFLASLASHPAAQKAVMARDSPWMTKCQPLSVSYISRCFPPANISSDSSRGAVTGGGAVSAGDECGHAPPGYLNATARCPREGELTPPTHTYTHTPPRSVHVQLRQWMFCNVVHSAIPSRPGGLLPHARLQCSWPPNLGGELGLAATGVLSNLTKIIGLVLVTSPPPTRPMSPRPIACTAIGRTARRLAPAS